MKKTITTILLSISAITFAVGCSSTSSAEAHASVKHINTSDIHDAVIRGAEKAGWITTEFKINEVIAEKINGDKSSAVSIKIIDGRVNYINESESVDGLSDLQDAISDEIHSGPSSH